MNTLLNYLIESNLSLCLLMLAYIVLLNKETDYNLKRYFLLIAVAVSVVAPLLHLELDRGPDGLGSYVPSLGDMLPTRWLPEITIAADGTAGTDFPMNAWQFIDIIYGVGMIVALSIFLIRIIALIRLFTKSKSVPDGDYRIMLSAENKSSFSFFKFIFVGLATSLSVEEQSLIIKHEQVHARRLHSFDILLINVIGIFFWFNPIIRIYKKTFVQLHEFEADARAAENADVDNYCSLLAKVALLSADFKLANHFSNSLTVKRIEMMRKIKSRISRWKFAAMALTIPSVFLVMACQDQLAEVSEVAKNSSSALIVPDVVQAKYDELKKQRPESKLVMLQLNSEGTSKLVELEKQYGVPRSMNIFKADADGEFRDHAKMTEAENARFQGMPIQTNGEQISYAILEYNESVARVGESSKDGDQVYTVVEEQAEFPGGIDGLIAYLQNNLTYPTVAREKGIEGTVFVGFIVNKDGSLSDTQVMKSLTKETDDVAVAIVAGMPNWTPGKQSGNTVRSRFVLPIKFKLGS